MTHMWLLTTGNEILKNITRQWNTGDVDILVGQLTSEMLHVDTSRNDSVAPQRN